MRTHNEKPVKLPFETPPNYFEEFENRLEKRLKGEYEPKGIHKNLPFGLPESYFELLPQKIMQKIQNLRRAWAWYETPFGIWTIRLGVATMIIFAIVLIFPKTDNSTAVAELKKNLETINKKELELYLFAHYQNHLEAELFDKDIQLPEMHQYQPDSLQIRKKDLEEVLPDEHIEEILQQELENSEVL
jgi:hypothetical protein